MSERYYSGINVVKELTDANLVNEHLRSGDWELLTIKQRGVSKASEIPGMGIEIIYDVVYILTPKVETKTKSVASPPTSTSVPVRESGAAVWKKPEVTVENIELLPWAPYKQGGGEWVFADYSRYRDDPEKGYTKLSPEQARVLVDLMRSIGPENKELTLGPYIYKFSGEKDMFIARRLTKK